MTRRALAAFARVQKAGRDAVIVTHGGVIAAIAHLSPRGKTATSGKSPNGGGYVIEDGEYTPFSPR